VNPVVAGTGSATQFAVSETWSASAHGSVHLRQPEDRPHRTVRIVRSGTPATVSDLVAAAATAAP
jgi:hypothetical protein